MRFRILISILVLTAYSSGSAWAGGAKPTLKSIGDQVYCLCGCVTTLNHCPHIPSDCPNRGPMEDQIKKAISQGKDETTIIQDLVLRYGVEVLASPPAKGFNLTVWVLPGVGLVLGLALVVFVVRRWRIPPGGIAKPASAPRARVDPELVAAVEQEIKRLMG